MSDQPTSRLARSEAATRTFVLDALAGLLLLGSLAAAVTAVVLPINQLTQPGGATRVELSPEAQGQAVAAITGVPDGSWLEFVPNLYSMSLHVFSVGWPLRLLSEIGTSLLLACLAGAGVLLSRTLRAIRAGAPFHPANPRRLRLIGLLLVIGGLGGQALDAVARVALAMAEAFAVGRRLTDDVAGLV